MAQRSFTVARYEEIQRRLAEGRGLREIARALGCSRRTVREVRDGERASPDQRQEATAPLWMAQLDWLPIIHDLGLGHPMKLIWEEKAQGLTTYSNFWKQFYRQYPQYRQAAVTAREFEPGERVEVDYAGDTLEWIDLRTGEIHQAYVFVAGLGFSQLLFAWAAGDMKSGHWLAAHRRMFEAYGGAPAVTVPDCLKQGVLKCHLYDPDLNPAYAELAAHYSTSVVPARPAHPKDKAVVEGLVKILMRYVRFRSRHRRFTSLADLNRVLAECAEQINDRPHTRFGVSRRERFEQVEKAALRPLPTAPFENAEWKQATLHPDCYVSVEAAYYSAPHIHRGKVLRVKLTENQVEIFLELERLAIYPRDRRRGGYRHKIDAHFPPASRAYYEATPQRLLSQSRFIDPVLNGLVVELFNADVYGNLRRVQGLIRSCSKELNQAGRELAIPRITGAIATMRRFGRIRVGYFQELLAQTRRQALQPEPAREIVRQPCCIAGRDLVLEPDFHAHLLERALRVGRQRRGKCRQHALTALDQHDARRARIDHAEILGQRVLAELGDRACEFHAGGARADDGEGHQPLALGLVGRGLGALEGQQDAAADQGGVVHALEARRNARPVVVAEIIVRGAGGEDQPVVGELAPVVEPRDFSLLIHAGNFAEQHARIGLVAQHAADRPGDVRRIQARGRDLVQQRLEQVEVAAIHHRDIHRRFCQRLRGGEPSEAGADDQHLRASHQDSPGATLTRSWKYRGACPARRTSVTDMRRVMVV